MAKKKNKRRRTVKLLLLIAAATILILGVVLIGFLISRVFTSSTDKPSDDSATTTTTAPEKPDPLFVDGHYVQQEVPTWNLRLVNGWNPLPADYDYEADLTDYSNGRMFDSRATEALRSMLTAGKAHGLWTVSLFRPYDQQLKLFENEVADWEKAGYSREEAEKMAATEVARPGTSEHHTGLAADILSEGIYSLEESFENTEAFRWLQEHCAEYGFILRYPKDKEEITGVIYEPWHYRYVGVEAATAVMSRGICLEEYLAEVYG